MANMPSDSGFQEPDALENRDEQSTKSPFNSIFTHLMLTMSCPLIHGEYGLGMTFVDVPDVLDALVLKTCHNCRAVDLVDVD
jgi:hypothetical protein